MMNRRMDRIHLLTRAEVSGRIGEKMRTMGERFGEKPEALLRAEFGGMTDANTPLPTLPVPALLDAARTAALWKDKFPRSVAREISLAEEMIEGRIPVFSSVVEHREGIDWHLEPGSGRRAPLRFYRDIDTLDPAVVGDVKQIWEINRCNFLVTLGRAYAATGRREFYEAWKRIVTSWIDANPHNMGVNWESSLELSIRAINWLWSAVLFSAELREDPGMRGRFMQSLYLHGRHIERHISYYFSPNTHLTGEALGLLYIGTAYPGLSCVGRWVKTAEEILEKELRQQILPDGGYFEMTTWYHKYTIDFYLSYLLLSSRPGDEIRSIVLRTVRHLALLAAPDGTIPLTGDSDGGRLLFLSPSKADVRGACCAAAVILEDGGLKHLCGGLFEEEALWLVGEEGSARFEGLETTAPESVHSINRDTGLYCFRTGMGPDDTMILIDCGPHGWRNCGHAHADLLSFVLYLGGDAVVVDPGTFTYSGSKQIRDESRSSLRHNTVSFNGISQSEPGGTFGWLTRAAPGRARCFFSGDFGIFAGQALPSGGTGHSHARVVYFFSGRLAVIFDFIDAPEKPFSFLGNLQFAPGRLEETGEGLFRFTAQDREHHIRVVAPGGSRLEVSEAQVYPDYDLSVPAPRLMVTHREVRAASWMATIISEDRELVKGVVFDENGDMTSSSNGVSVRIKTLVEDMNPDLFDIKASAVFREGGRTLVALQNSGMAAGAEGDTVLELTGEHGFISAVLEGGTVSLTTGDTVPRMKLNEAVEKIYLNGRPALFRRSGDWIEIDFDPVKGS
jgi:hypothetical protein